MEITYDSFLGGSIQVQQPQTGYRAGIDAVLLAASIPAMSNQSILDIGCGVGTVSLCLNARIEHLTIHGFDGQPALVSLAQTNAQHLNNVTFFQSLLQDEINLQKNSFDHVITNPPYFKKQHSTLTNNLIRLQADFESIDLAEWINLCLKYVKPKGMLSVIHCASRLDEIIQSIQIKRKSITIIPLWPSAEREANRVIIQIVKDSAAPLKICPGLVIHANGQYTQHCEQILRFGAPLNCA